MVSMNKQIKGYTPYLIVAALAALLLLGNGGPLVIQDQTVLVLFGAAITIKHIVTLILLGLLLRYLPSPFNLIIIIGLLLYLLSFFGFFGIFGSSGILTLILVLLLIVFIIGLI